MQLSDITDWFIPEGKPREATVYPGPQPVPEELSDVLRTIHEMARERSTVHDDYTIGLDKVSYRGHKQVTVEGTMHILRRLPKNPPDIDKLGLATPVVRILTSARFAPGGGLILVCGEAGHGKSTTVAALVMARVVAHGSYCLTVEDPPEFPLHGDHVAQSGKMGKVVQVPVGDGGFERALRNALRCYPANVRGSMLMVGEVQDSGTAGQLLRAAMNGQLVLSTVHAANPIAAIERIVSLATPVIGEDQARSILAQSLRAVLHQKLSDGRMSMSPLFSTNATTPVASKISQGTFSSLSNELQQQAMQLTNGMLTEKVLGV